MTANNAISISIKNLDPDEFDFTFGECEFGGSPELSVSDRTEETLVLLMGEKEETYDVLVRVRVNRKPK